MGFLVSTQNVNINFRFGTVVYFLLKHTINVYSWFDLTWACEHTHFLSLVIDRFDRKFVSRGGLVLKTDEQEQPFGCFHWQL